MASNPRHRGGRNTSTRGNEKQDGPNKKPADTNNVGLPPTSEEVVWKEGNRIVVGFDIGSTQSGVAFAYLPQGGKQILHRVSQWPGEASQSKIPTQIWYDKNGNAKSFGAKAISEEDKQKARQYGWTLAQHFKLRLHPSELISKYNIKLDPLPKGVSLYQVYADFMKYLFDNTKLAFESRITGGAKIWEEHQSNILFVLAHPNGWGIRQQEFLRSAAIQAGLVDKTTSSEQIRFVTEAEASVHYCIDYSNIREVMKPGMRFAVCDAGGSTVDTTVYNVLEVHPQLKLEEEREPACIQAGGIYVDAAAQQYLEQLLAKADLSEEEIQEYTEMAVNIFEQSPKRLYADESEALMVRIGAGLKIPGAKIYRGVLTIPSSESSQFFDRCIRDVVANVDEQIRGLNVSHVLLVGGFGDSPYLRKQLEQKCKPLGCEITIANEPTAKAVAEGAVRWNTVTSVFRRRPRWSYGIQGYTRFDPQLDEHWDRPTFNAADGHKKISGIWCEIVKKGVPIEADSVHRQPFVRTYDTPHPDLRTFEIALFTYSDNDKPEWIRNKNGTLNDGFEQACLLEANLTGMSGALESKIGPQNQRYWGVLFWVCVRFGDTELTAYLEWEEKKKMKRSEIKKITEKFDTEATPSWGD